MSSPPWLVTMTFFVEGILLLMVACMGLVGNILSFVVLKSQKVHKTFHNLLILLNTFDMVSKPYFITLPLTRHPVADLPAHLHLHVLPPQPEQHVQWDLSEAVLASHPTSGSYWNGKQVQDIQ